MNKMVKKGVFLIFAILFSILIFCGIAGATDITGCGTLSSSGTYNLVSPITNDASATCFSITSSDVILDCLNTTNWIDGAGGVGTIGIDASSISNVTIRNCNLTDWERTITINNLSNSTLENLISKKQNSFSFENILISNSNNIIMDGIDFVIGGNGRGILLQNTNYSEIKNSKGTGLDLSAGFGIIRLESSYNNNLSNITITQSISIVLLSGDYNNFENIRTDNGLARSSLTIDGNYNNISHFEASVPSFSTASQGGNGIDLGGNNNNLSYLNISGFPNLSPFVWGAIGITGSNNSITKSYFRNNSFAISFDGDFADYNNSIYDNIFSENSTTILGNGVRNYTQHFNTTKIAGTNIIGGSYLGGNAWFGLNGTDADGDGFFDNPYIINETSMIDYLPLNSSLIVPFNFLPIINSIEFSEVTNCVPPNTTLVIRIFASDNENDTINYAHRCSDLDATSTFNSNNTKTCLYGNEGEYNLGIFINDTGMTAGDYVAYYQYVRVTTEKCIKACATCTPIPIDIVDVNNVNQGLLPTVYLGLISFISAPLPSVFIIFIVIIAVLLISLIGIFISKVAKFGEG